MYPHRKPPRRTLMIFVRILRNSCRFSL